MPEKSTDKPKMSPVDRLMTPKQVAGKMQLNVRTIYEMIGTGYFRVYYPNGPGRRPVRVWESSVLAHIEAFSISSEVPAQK